MRFLLCHQKALALVSSRGLAKIVIPRGWPRLGLIQTQLIVCLFADSGRPEMLRPLPPVPKQWIARNFLHRVYVQQTAALGTMLLGCDVRGAREVSRPVSGPVQRVDELL